jgi:intermembrane space import and assembly protein 40
MAHGPCGPEFREAFSCFVFSEEEPKGIDCVEKFKAMQDCFRRHPEIYSEGQLISSANFLVFSLILPEIMDDEEEEAAAAAPASGVAPATAKADENTSSSTVTTSIPQDSPPSHTASS